MVDQRAEMNDFAAMTNAWTKMTTRFVHGATAANRAAISAMFGPLDDGSQTKPSVDEHSVPSLTHELTDWNFERSVDVASEITVGDTVRFEKTITDDDVRDFARISGDTNRLHLDDDFAEQTRFGQRIVHGTLVSGLISAALARIPGLTIYLSQDLEFRAPVPIGSHVEGIVEVVEDLGNEQYRLHTQIRNADDDTVVIDGEAVVLIDDLPEDVD